MKEDNWKKIIENWKASRKHQEIKKKLNSRRMYTLKKEEILLIIDEIKEFHSLTDEEKEAFDWLDPEMINETHKEGVIQSLIETLIKWHFYMYKYEIAQEYEVCTKIRDVISIEIEECKRVIDTYYVTEEDDNEMYILLRKQSKESVELNYSAWVKYLNREQ